MTTTREQLLEAALQLFAEKGFWGVSLSQVAECCSITKQSLLHHFGSKEKLYREILGRIAGQVTGYNRPRRRWISRKPNWLLYWKDWTQVSGKWSRGSGSSCVNCLILESATARFLAHDELSRWTRQHTVWVTGLAKAAGQSGSLSYTSASGRLITK